MKGIPVYFSTWRLSAFALAMFLLVPLAQAGLFDDDEARKAILELRQRVGQGAWIGMPFDQHNGRRWPRTWRTCAI